MLPPALDADDEAIEDRSAAVSDGWDEDFGAAGAAEDLGT